MEELSRIGVGARFRFTETLDRYIDKQGYENARGFRDLISTAH